MVIFIEFCQFSPQKTVFPQPTPLRHSLILLVVIYLIFVQNGIIVPQSERFMPKMTSSAPTMSDSFHEYKRKCVKLDKNRSNTFEVITKAKNLKRKTNTILLANLLANLKDTHSRYY